MARGPSGKTVIEIPPVLKQELYAALEADGLTMKDWFHRCVAAYLGERANPSLPGMVEEPHATWGAVRIAKSGNRTTEMDS